MKDLDLVEKIEKEVESFFEIGEQIVVGVSGGADSMVLLSCLLNSRKNFNLIVAHLNHCLRGREGERDEEFVCNFCKKNSIRYVCKSQEIKKIALENKMSLEECGRICRYSFFESIGGRIATAHTLSDLVETFFINISRGCGLKGLLSIPQKRGKIVRPLLSFKRQEIEEYCRINGIKFVDDSTNFEENFLRNRIRLNVIPQLKKIECDFEGKILRTIENLRQDEEFLNFVAQGEYEKIDFESGIFLKNFNKIHSSIKIRVIEKFLKLNGIPSNKNVLNRVEKLCEKGVGREEINANFFVSVKRGRLFLEKTKKIENFTVLIPNVSEFSYKNLYFIRCDVKSCSYFIKKTNYLFLFKFDCDKISGDIVLRRRKNKDKIKLLNRPTKTLKALMQEKRMLKNEKDETILLCDSLGVFWVFGFGLDVRVLPDDFSKKLCLVFEKI